MEPPTPQCVGREFVRQYYTLLNQAPLHLHRLELIRWRSGGGGTSFKCCSDFYLLFYSLRFQLTFLRKRKECIKECVPLC